MKFSSSVLNLAATVVVMGVCFAIAADKQPPSESGAQPAPRPVDQKEVEAGRAAEWWLYGEDAHYFYAQGDRDGLIYIAFPRSKTSECPSFQRHDWTTWCGQFQRLHEST
jgi:hypothetical protein